jgi:PEP-CTERM motif
MRTHPKLENKLDAYERTAGENRRSGNTGRRNWRAYAAAAGSGLALTTSAEAGIIYSGPLNTTAAVGPNTTAQWATNIHGAHLTARISRATSGPFRSVLQNAFMRNGSALTNGGGLRRLASGAQISHGAGNFRTASNSHPALIHNFQSHSGHINTSGSFRQKSAPAFFGIKVGGDYGWVEVKWGGTTGGLPTSLTLLGWAYETTAGAAIAAGDTGLSTVPEPSTALMGLLAAGAGGVLAWRKRRQVLAAASA